MAQKYKTNNIVKSTVQKNPKQNNNNKKAVLDCDNRNLKRSGKKTNYLIPPQFPIVINISSFIMTLLTDSVTL